MMFIFPSPHFAKADGPPPVIGPIDPVTLFGAGETGGYWDFTVATSLAVNADGTGGVPAVGDEFRSALDQSPNGHRLRNNLAASVTRLAGGMKVHGNSGLYNIPGLGPTHGDWVTIAAPFEIIAVMEQLSYAGLYTRVLRDYGGAVGFLQGSASGQSVVFSGAVSADYATPLATEMSIDLCFPGGGPTLSIDNGAPSVTGTNAQTWNGFMLGGDGGAAAVDLRFKRVLFIGRALTAAERTGVYQWMIA